MSLIDFPAMWDCQNPDGTWNGARMMARWTGITEAEVIWTWRRLQQLLGTEGKTKNQALAIVKQEAKEKPWLT